MRSHLDQLQVNRHYTLKIMPLLLNSAKYCWDNYFCVVLLPCGTEPNVIPAPPGSSPTPLHIRPSGSSLSHSTDYDQGLCGFGSTLTGTCREIQTFFQWQWCSPKKICHISCAMPVLHEFCIWCFKFLYSWVLLCDTISPLWPLIFLRRWSFWF